MAVTRDDVRHVAELARLAVDASRLDALVAELNGILAHMDVLSQIDTKSVDAEKPEPEGTPLRSDSSGPIQMRTSREAFAPTMRDGFFLVPRLASHGDSVDRAP